MKEFIKNTNFSIFRDTNYSTLFQIKIPSRNLATPLFHSLMRTNIILGASISDNYDLLSFKASSIKTYHEYMLYLRETNGSTKIPYIMAIRMVYFLAKQVDYLIKKEDKSFCEFNLQNIIVIDESKFVYLGGEHLFDLDEEYLVISRPFTIRNIGFDIDFVSSEYANIREIPYNIHFKTIFYSLGRLLLYVLSNENSAASLVVDNQDIENWLKPIYETKLYWLIKRCLEDDPKKRCLVLV